MLMGEFCHFFPAKRACSWCMFRKSHQRLGMQIYANLICPSPMAELHLPGHQGSSWSPCKADSYSSAAWKIFFFERQRKKTRNNSLSCSHPSKPTSTLGPFRISDIPHQVSSKNSGSNHQKKHWDPCQFEHFCCVVSRPKKNTYLCICICIYIYM